MRQRRLLPSGKLGSATPQADVCAGRVAVGTTSGSEVRWRPGERRSLATGATRGTRAKGYPTPAASTTSPLLVRRLHRRLVILSPGAELDFDGTLGDKLLMLPVILY